MTPLIADRHWRELSDRGGVEQRFHVELARLMFIAELLGSDRLCEPATQALLAIGGKEAQQVLKSALPQASDRRKATMSQAVDLLSAR